MLNTRALSLSVLVSLLGAAFGASEAQACANEPTARWVPQRSSPYACETGVSTDAVVLLDGDAIADYALGGQGELKVFVQRIVEGAPVEDFQGKVSFPSDTSALFQADRALPASSDFIITAFRAGVDGAPIGDKFTSAFSTGTGTLPSLSMASEPTLTYEESDRKRQSCNADACGVTRCTTSEDKVHVRSLRVAVPEINGGVANTPYRVTAELVATFAAGEAPAVATSDSAATQADKRSYFVLDVPALADSAEACVTIHVSDVGGHTMDSKPVCMKLDPDFGGAPKGDELGAGSQIKITTKGGDDTEEEPIETLALSSSIDEASVAHASAGGCSIGPARSGVGLAGWLGLALTLARLRPRKRSANVG